MGSGIWSLWACSDQELDLVVQLLSLLPKERVLADGVDKGCVEWGWGCI